MNVTLVDIIEREYWGEASILRIVNGGVYICTCSVRSDEYMCKTKHEFVITVTSNHCTNQNIVWLSLIIELMHLFLFWGIITGRQGSIWDMPWNNSLVYSALWNLSTKKSMLIKNMLSIIHIVWYINDWESTWFVIWHIWAWKKQEM